MEFSKRFIFASFGIVRLPKLGKFFGNSWSFQTCKNFAKIVWKFLESSEIVLFQTFQKLQKNDVKIEFWKSQKTCSDSKTDSNVQFKAWNARP